MRSVFMSLSFGSRHDINYFCTIGALVKRNATFGVALNFMRIKAFYLVYVLWYHLLSFSGVMWVVCYADFPDLGVVKYFMKKVIVFSFLCRKLSYYRQFLKAKYFIFMKYSLSFFFPEDYAYHRFVRI